MKAKNLPGIPVVVYSCPLSSKIPALNNPFALRCKEIIEQSRHIWGYFSDEYKSCCYEIVDGEEVPKKFPQYSTLKLISARSILSWYVERSDLILTNSKTPDAIKKAVQDVRRYARPGIESSIKDKEILAIFAIYEAFDAVYKIQRGETEDAIKEKVLTASMFLKLAKTGIESVKQKVKDVIPFPLPSGAKVSDIKMVFLNDKNVRITIKKESKPFHYTEMGFSHAVTKEPLAVWHALLEYAENNGAVVRKVTSKIQKDSERINGKLQAFFATNEKLFVNHQPLFDICKRETKDKKPGSIQSKECSKCKETHKHFCFVCKDETNECKECHDEFYESTHAKLNR